MWTLLLKMSRIFSISLKVGRKQQKKKHIDMRQYA